MSEIEMAVEALKRCVDPDAYSKAMQDVRDKNWPKEVHIPVPVKLTADQVTKRLLRDVGIPTHIRGYRYTVTGILLIAERPDIADAITKELYPQIGKVHNTTPSRVERAIRHSIEVAWSRGDLDVLKNYFGNTVSSFEGKPTNSEFLTRMAEAVQEKMAE